MFKKMTPSRLRFIAPLVLSVITLATTAFSTPAMAATSTYIGAGGGYAGQVHVYSASFNEQFTFMGTGHFEVSANVSAPSNISYNWTTEVEELVNGSWTPVGWSPVYRATGNSGNWGGLQGFHDVSGMDGYHLHWFRAFFWVQNPYSGAWYYAGALSGAPNGTLYIAA